MKKAVAYYHISTDRHSKSGLGLEAQSEAVSQFARQDSYDIIDTFTEIESGRKKSVRSY